MYRKDKIRMKVHNKVTSKLAFVKIVKEYTGLGLRDSKFHVDTIMDNYDNGIDRYEEIQVYTDDNVNRFSKLGEFRKTLSETGIDCTLIGGVQWERTYKMLELGIGDAEDYREFIKEYTNSDPAKFIDILLSVVSDDSLELVFKKISKDIKENYDSNL